MELSTRPYTKYEHLAMKWCYDVAELSCCERTKVGAVIIVNNNTFITGYNGTLPGYENKCDKISLVCTECNIPVDPADYIVGEKHCKKGIIEKRPKTNIYTLHGEDNSISNASLAGISIIGGVMCVTTSPCVNCAMRIIRAKIGTVIFDKYHDDLRGLQMLIEAEGIEVYKYARPSNSDEELGTTANIGVKVEDQMVLSFGIFEEQIAIFKYPNDPSEYELRRTEGYKLAADHLYEVLGITPTSKVFETYNQNVNFTFKPLELLESDNGVLRLEYVVDKLQYTITDTDGTIRYGDSFHLGDIVYGYMSNNQGINISAATAAIKETIAEWLLGISDIVIKLSK